MKRKEKQFRLLLMVLMLLSCACKDTSDDIAPYIPPTNTHNPPNGSGDGGTNNPTDPNDDAPTDMYVLFVGNSLTYSNDLPGLFTSYAKSKGVKVKAESLANPNYAIVDHWYEQEVQRLIATKWYDYVVIQQGPSSQADGKQMLEEYGAKYKELCMAYNTKLAFFMVWPARANYHTFDGVIRNYTNAAELTNSLLCPVGRVWKEHFDATGDFSYYSGDQFHPSKEGSQSAAEIIFNSLK